MIVLELNFYLKRPTNKIYWIGIHKKEDLGWLGDWNDMVEIAT